MGNNEKLGSDQELIMSVLERSETEFDCNLHADFTELEITDSGVLFHFTYSGDLVKITKGN